MYLPRIIEKARVLVAVKTYPQPSQTHGELVCNAGFVSTDGIHWKWIRIYPVHFRNLHYEQQYRKFQWIELNLKRRRESDDYRQESYMPVRGIEEKISAQERIGTGKDGSWAARKDYALQEIFGSMNELIDLAKARHVWKSLATVKPKEFVSLEIEPDEREWAPKFRRELYQLNLLEVSGQMSGQTSRVVSKLPYRYYYRFLTEGDQEPRKMMIGDWEIGALYWKMFRESEGDEDEANRKVRQKYEEEFFKKDLYLFVGTTLANHHKAINPFMIIGVFYPPVSIQPSLFTK